MAATWQQKVSDRIRHWWPQLTVVALVVYAFFAIILKDGGFMRMWDMRERRDNVAEKVEQLKQQKDQLTEEIELLEELDSTMVESESREQGLAREGEKVFWLDYKEVPDSTLADE